jgi:hypothetical protein
MKVYNSLADLAGLVPPPAPEPEKPAPHTYDCTGCRFADTHGLVCEVCLRKILDRQAERKASLLAACFEGRGCVTLLRGRRAILV